MFACQTFVTPICDWDPYVIPVQNHLALSASTCTPERVSVEQFKIKQILNLTELREKVLIFTATSN
jgi:hypothetical protein